MKIPPILIDGETYKIIDGNLRYKALKALGFSDDQIPTETVNIMKQVTEHSLHIFDNDGKTFDRYTIVMPNGDVHGASKNPTHPQGFGQFSHSIDDKVAEFTFEGKADFIAEAQQNPDWLGKEIAFQDCPEKVQEFILQRICGYDLSENQKTFIREAYKKGFDVDFYYKGRSVDNPDCPAIHLNKKEYFVSYDCKVHNDIYDNETVIYAKD